MKSRFPALLIAAALLAACSSPLNQQQQTLPAVSNPSMASNAVAAHGTGSLVVRVTVPREHLRDHYLSPATRSISVKITGPTNVTKSASLKLGVKGCKSRLVTLACTLNIPGLTACPTKSKCYTGSISTFDAAMHLLSGDQSLKFWIGSTPTIVPLTLYGVPASVAFMPSASTALTGSQAGGYTWPKCTSTAQSVSLLSMDVDGNFIVGIGSPKLSLTSGTPSQITVSAGSSPGTFTLTPPASPAYPYGLHTVNLTATATPSTKSGGSAANSTIAVTYSGDICGTFAEYPIPTSGAFVLDISTGPD
jgi:hypothetical protein